MLFVSKGNLVFDYFTTLQLVIVSCGGIRTSPRTVQIIFHFLWDHWTHCGIFEKAVLLIYMLEDVSCVANFITAYEESR